MRQRCSPCAQPLPTPPRTAPISVKPGKWKWLQETNILAIPLKEENLECLIPEEARITLSKLARDLEEGCTVDNVPPISGGYSFKLICKGKTTGNAKATLTHTPTSMSIRAEGSANIGFIPAGFSMKADATYQGDCTAGRSRQGDRALQEGKQYSVGAAADAQKHSRPGGRLRGRLPFLERVGQAHLHDRIDLVVVDIVPEVLLLDRQLVLEIDCRSKAIRLPT